MPKRQRNSSVLLSSLLPKRPSRSPYKRKCRRKLTSVLTVPPWVGSGVPWKTCSGPTVTSDGAMSPSLFASLKVYGKSQYPPRGYPSWCRCEAPPKPKMLGLIFLPVAGSIPKSISRLRFPQALAVTLHEKSGVVTGRALSSISTPLLLTAPRLRTWSVLTPDDVRSRRRLSEESE